MTLARISRIFGPPIRWPWPMERKPLRVEHVRYVKEPKRDKIRETTRKMCADMGIPVPKGLPK